jgi:hypothetical protein
LYSVPTRAERRRAEGEKYSLTAQDAEGAEEGNSLTAKDAKAAKRSIIRTKS